MFGLIEHVHASKPVNRTVARTVVNAQFCREYIGFVFDYLVLNDLWRSEYVHDGGMLALLESRERRNRHVTDIPGQFAGQKRHVSVFIPPASGFRTHRCLPGITGRRVFIDVLRCRKYGHGAGLMPPYRRIIPVNHLLELQVSAKRVARLK